MYKKYTTRQPSHGMWGSRKTSYDGPANKKNFFIQTVRWEVVVAQLVERLLLIPEVRGSTPVIGKILLSICLLSAVLKRQK